MSDSDWFDDEEAEEIFPSSDHEWERENSYIDEFDYSKPPVLLVDKPLKNRLIYTGDVDSIDGQGVVFSEYRKSKLKEKNKSIFCLSKEDLENKSHKNKTPNEEGNTNMNMQSYPEVPGFIGPQRDGQGYVFYTDARDGRMYSGDDVLRYIQSMQPQQNPYNQPPPIHYNQPQQAYGVPPGYSPNQPPQYMPDPRMNNGYNQPVPSMNRFNDNGMGGGSLYSNAPVNNNAPVDPYMYGGSGILPGNTQAAPIQQDKQPHVINANRPLGVHEYRITKETINKIIDNNIIIKVAHNNALQRIIKVADSNNNLVDVLVNRGSITMDKNNHIALDVMDNEAPVLEIVEKIKQTPAKPVPSDKKLLFSNKRVTSSTISDVILTAERISIINDGVPVLIKGEVTTNLANVDATTDAVTDLVSASKDGNFIDTYLELRSTFKPIYPSLVTYIDNKLSSITNDILTYSLNAGFRMTGAFHEDVSDLRDELYNNDDLEEFEALLSAQCLDDFNFNIDILELSDGDDFTAISNLETVVLLYSKLKELDDPITTGLIDSERYPELHESITAAREALPKGYSKYIYIVNRSGKLIKVMSSKAKVPALSLHYITSIIK